MALKSPCTCRPPDPEFPRHVGCPVHSTTAKLKFRAFKLTDAVTRIYGEYAGLDYMLGHLEFDKTGWAFIPANIEGLTGEYQPISVDPDAETHFIEMYMANARAEESVREVLDHEVAGRQVTYREESRADAETMAKTLARKWWRSGFWPD